MSSREKTRVSLFPLSVRSVVVIGALHGVRVHCLMRSAPAKATFWTVLCVFRCYQMDDYSPAKNLMTMCFTYYYYGTLFCSHPPCVMSVTN